MVVGLSLLWGYPVTEGGSQDDLRAMSRGGGGRMPRPIRESEERRVGRAVAAQILSQYPLSKDDRLTLYVNQVGLAVARKSSRPGTLGGYHFGVLDTPEHHTFSCPGGIILISRAVIQMCDREDELAAVLAHEVAHVAHRDGIKAIRQSRWAEAAAPLRVKAAEERGGGGRLAMLAGLFEGSVDDVAKTMMVKGFSRATELAADQEALRTLRRAGYDPQALVSLLVKMAAYEQKGWIRFKTHPPARFRLARIKAQLDQGQPADDQWQVRAQRFQAHKP